MRLAVTVAADMGGELVCPAPRHRKLRSWPSWSPIQGWRPDGRDLAGRGARVTSLTEIGLPEQTNRQGTTRLEEHDLDRRRDHARASFV